MSVDTVRKDFKNGNRLTKIYIRGHLRFSYRYPTIESVFSSELVNYGNLNFVDSFMEDCVCRVLNGLKPMGTVLEKDNSIIKKIESDIKSSPKFRYKIINDTGYNNKYTELLIAVNSTIGKLFNLDFLVQDYSSYFLKAGFTNSFLQETVTYIESLYDRNLSDFFDYDYANPKTSLDLITTGLILGYPIETTTAIIIRDYLKRR